jgi:hypothetical protein
MAEALKDRFLKSKGSPIEIDGKKVVTLDRVKISRGHVVVTFTGTPGKIPNGIIIKSAKGHVLLSDKKKAKSVYIWDDIRLPRRVEHEVYCPNGELLIWNIYRVNPKDDITRADYWTNNAGMFVEQVAKTKRRYHCSDGIGDFDPTDLVFELEWIESK